MTCREAILSEQTYDYVTDFPVEEVLSLNSVLCYEPVDDTYNVIYVDNAYLPSLDPYFFEYQGIPKLYGLMQIEGDDPMFPSGTQQAPFDPLALISAGISQVQGPPLNLTGAGTLVCFIDTGIDFTNPLFRDELGRSRIEAIWDQSIQTGTPPEGFLYGSVYYKDQIDEALQSTDPWAVVPSRDEVGHGTALASVAAGSVAGTAAGSPASAAPVRTIPAGFRGAAPEAGIIVVKVKPAKEYLRDYYLLPQGALAYQENDLMLAVKFCDEFARVFQRPIVICLGIGTAMGNHNGSSPLSAYLNKIAKKRSRVVVACGGNEGNGAGHYRGDLSIPVSGAAANARDVEIRVAEGNDGFYLELWGRRTNVINVEIRSPGGEVIPPIPLGLRQSITFSFVYERTKVTIYSTLIEPSSGDELIYFRFVDPTPGIWIIRVIGKSDAQEGIFDMWLPLLQFRQTPVYFLSPSPDVTLTEPSLASEVITVTAYNPANASFYIESGRGFAQNGIPRPDIAAPGVDISTVYGKQSGSGFAAALTAGAVAQFLQWAVVEGNNVIAETRTVKGYLIRGAKRDADLSYPNREWGYGRLDLVGTFTSLRG